MVSQRQSKNCFCQKYLDLLAENATRLVDGLERQFRAIEGELALLRRGAGDRKNHADLDSGALRSGAFDKRRCRERCSHTDREIASR